MNKLNSLCINFTRAATRLRVIDKTYAPLEVTHMLRWKSKQENLIDPRER